MNTLSGYSKSTLTDNFVLSAAGGHLAVGNADKNIPLNNGTVNTNLNADLVDGLHLYQRNLGINGTNYVFASTYTSGNSTFIYAPASAGTSGQLLISSGGIPSWTNQSSITAGAASKVTVGKTTDNRFRPFVLTDETSPASLYYTDKAKLNYSTGEIQTSGKISSSGVYTTGDITLYNGGGSGDSPALIFQRDVIDNYTSVLDWKLFVSSGDLHMQNNYNGWHSSLILKYLGGASLDGYDILTTGNYTSYLGYIGTTAVQSTSKNQSLTGIGNINMSGNIIITTSSGDSGILQFTRGGSVGDSGALWDWRIYVSAGHLYFQTDQGTGSWNTELFINTSHNVGIGTDSPSAKLHISGGLLNITNGSYGTLTIGAQNASYTHYSTTGGTHWFNKQVEVAGYLYPHSDNKHSLGSSGKRWSDFYSMQGNFYGNITFQGENLGVYGGGKGILGSMDSSNTWDGVAGYACNVVGSIKKPLVLRSSSDDLYHYNKAANTKYQILDTGNVLTLSDVGVNVSPYNSSTGWVKFMTLVGTNNDGTVDFIISTSEVANMGVSDYFHFEARYSDKTRTFTCSHLGKDSSYIRGNIYAYTSDNKTYTFWLKYSEANKYARWCRVRHIMSRGGTVTYHDPTVFQTSTPSGTSYQAEFAGSVKNAEKANDANKISGNTLSNLDDRYVNVSGDTMNGALYFDDNTGVYNSQAGMLAYVTSGNGWTGATDLANTVVVGTTSANTVIRSSGDTLYHYYTNLGSRYKIWDAGNSNLTTVPWTVSTLHVGASNKYIGTDAGVNDLWFYVGNTYVLNCNAAESCVRRGTTATNITLGSSTYPWKGLYSGFGHFTENVTLYAASGDSPMLYFQRGDINYTDTFDWRMFVSGGHFYLQHDSGAWTNGLQINYTGEAYVHGAQILTTSNITSRNLTINGTGRMFYSSYTTDCGEIYAPTTAGTSGYILKSNGSGAPTWIAQSSVTAGAVSCTEATSNNDRPIVGTNQANALFYSTKATVNWSTGNIKCGSITFTQGYGNISTSSASEIQLQYGMDSTKSVVLNNVAFKPYIASSKLLKLGAYNSLWNGVYVGEHSSSAINNVGIVYCDTSGYIKHSIGATSSGPGFGMYSSGTIYLRAGCTKASSVDTALNNSGTGLILDAAGNVTITGKVTASSFSGSMAWSNITGKPTIPTVQSRCLTINGTARYFYSEYNTDCGNIYAPTTAGTANQYLISNGSGAPIWRTIDPYDYNISRTANTVLAAPNGSAGKATFRKLVVADLPISARSLTVNGTAYTFYSNTTTAAASFYAPTSAGTSGYILQSTGGTPSWTSRLSYDYPGILWVGYIYRSSRSSTSYYASKLGGKATFSLTSSPNSSYEYLSGTLSGYTSMMAAFVQTQAVFSNSTTTCYAYSSINFGKAEEAGFDTYRVSISGSTLYIRACRMTDSNNSSWEDDGFLVTGSGHDGHARPVARLYLMIVGY